MDIQDDRIDRNPPAAPAPTSAPPSAPTSSASASPDTAPGAPPPSPPPPVPSSPSLPPSSLPPLARRRSHMPAMLGIIAAVVVLLLAAAFVTYRYLTRDTGQTTITGGVLTTTPSGLYFRNTPENIAFVAPATWSRYPTASAQIMVRGDGCSFGLLEQRTNLSVPAFASAEARDLKRRHPEANPIVAPRTIAGHNGLAFTGAYTDSEGGPMSQTYILVDRGATVITMIETATDPLCAQAFANLEDSLHL